MTEQDNLRIVHELVDAINAHDADAFVKHLDTSFVQEAETTGKLHGPGSARQRLNMMFQAFPDLAVNIEHAMASGNRVVMQLHYSGTNQASFAGIAPTHKTVTWRACVVNELRSGKAVHARIYSDNLTMFGQLGVVQIPKAASA